MTRTRFHAGRPRLSAIMLRLLLSAMLVSQPIVLAAADDAQVAPVLTAAGLTGLLDNLQGRLDAIINHAANEVRDIVRVLADQIATEIAAARQMLHTELEFQRQRVLEAVNSMINNIRSSVEALERNLFGLVHDGLNQAQLIAMTIPFSRRDPMLKGYDPPVAFPTGAPTDDFHLSVFGVFADVGRRGYDPTLEVSIPDSAGTPQARTFPATGATQITSQFLIPNALLFTGPKVIQRLNAKLHVPFRSRFLLFFHRKTDRVFPMTLGLLPSSPGTLRVSFSNTSEVWDSRVSSSGVMQQTAASGDDINHEQSVGPHSGYEVVPESVRISVLGASGDARIGTNCSTKLIACWRITTIQHHCFGFICPQGDDGVVTFKLTFTERQLVNRTTPVASVDIPIGWNQISHYTFPGTGVLSWNAVYTDFKENPFPFGSTNTDTRSNYMKVNQISERTWVFALYPFGSDIGADVTARATNPNGGATIRDLIGNLAQVSDLFSANLNPARAQGLAALTEAAIVALGRSLTLAPTAPTGLHIDLGDLISELNLAQRTTVSVEPTPPAHLTTNDRAGALNALKSANRSRGLQ